MAVLAAGLASCAEGPATDAEAGARGATGATGATGVTTAEAPDPDAPLELELTDLATDLEVPWALDIAPDGTMFLTERPGRLRVIEGGELVPEPVAELPVAPRGEGGLLGLALHPGFPDPPFAYLYSTREAPGGGLQNVVTRHRLTPGGPAGYTLSDERVLLDGIPADRIHNGGRIAFGPDGMLYVGTGDAGQPELAADRGSLAGKILRLDPAASTDVVPDDNPFPGSPVYSYGHRNVQGLAWDPDGVLYASEHGPSGEFGLCCRDEVNRIARGGYYGWPLRAANDPAADPGSVQVTVDAFPPIATSGGESTWAPGGLALLQAEPEGEAEVEAGPSLLVPQLAGQALLRLVIDPDNPNTVVREEVVLDGLGRLRQAVIDPEGCVLLLTSNRDGRGNPGPDDDRVVRGCPSG